MLRIKMAAVFLFATRGYAGTTIRDICALVNLTTAGVYHHVENKESLLVEIMRSGQQALNKTAETALVAAQNPSEALVVLVTSLTATHGQNRMLTRVTDGELRSLDRAQEPFKEILNLRDSYEASWRAAIQEGVSSGAFTVSDPTLMRLAVMSMCTGTSEWFRPGGRKGIDEVCAEFSQVALGVVGANTRPPALRAAQLQSLTLALVPTFPWEPSTVGTST